MKLSPGNMVVAILFAVPALHAQTAPVISLVANAEGEAPVIAPNTWVEIKGAHLAPAGDIRVWQGSDFSNSQMPVKLDGVSVTVNRRSAFIYYISPTQVNVLTPPDPMTGPVPVVVTNNGAVSTAFTVEAQTCSPSFFVINSGPYVLAQHSADYSLAGPTNLYPAYTTRAKPRETLVLYANGFGAITPAPVSGAMTQNGTLPALPDVTIGGIHAVVTYAGIAGFPGLFQFNVVVPDNAPDGDNQIAATYNRVTTSPVTLITVQNPAAATSAHYYVAPNGGSSWSGTLAAPNPGGTDGPFATFEQARAAVRSLNKAGFTQVTVQFRGGTYYLPATERLTAADSGSPSLQITYGAFPGESPVISGGVRLQNWTNISGNTWKTTLPPSTAYFEDLFYNGVRRLRPRLGGYLGTYYRVAAPVYLNAPGPPAAAPDANCDDYVSERGWLCYDRFQYAASDPIAANWKNLAAPSGNPCRQAAGSPALTGDVELIIWEIYQTSKLRISCIDPSTHMIYTTGPLGQGFFAKRRYLVENVQDAFTEAGQWFLDRSSTPWTLSYLANPGENPNTDIVIIPQLPEVLLAYNIQYVTFQGLTFAHGNYTIPDEGFADDFIEAAINPVVSIQNAQHVLFDSGIVTQTSGAGLEFISCVNRSSPDRCISTSASAVTANNIVQNSAFYDTGASAVRIGVAEHPSDNDANIPQFHLVQNNVVEGYGRVIPAAFGISQGEGHDNTYTHNDVYDGYHAGISICGCTGDLPTGGGAANNVISFNHVYNLFQGIANDEGAIHVNVGNPSFTATGNKVFNNKVHDVSDASALDGSIGYGGTGYGGDGIYVDWRSGFVDVENNLVYRVSGAPMEVSNIAPFPNQANTIKNNIFAFGRHAMVSRLKNDPNGPVSSPFMQQFVASNNIFYFDRNWNSSPPFSVQGGCIYSGNLPYSAYQDWNGNLYWRADGTFGSDPKAFHLQPNPAKDQPCSTDSNDWVFYTFSGWQKADGDVHGVVQNPGFANPAYPADDFTLTKGSPMPGFVVFDPNQAGRTNPVLKPPPVAATFPTKLFNPAADF